MDKSQLLGYHISMGNAARSIMSAKNDDYTGSGDIFANFTRSESMGICRTEAGMLVRMTDKISRLSSFVEKGFFEVDDERLEDTLLDLINYCVLFGAYVQGGGHDFQDIE